MSNNYNNTNNGQIIKGINNRMQVLSGGGTLYERRIRTNTLEEVSFV